MTSNISGNQSNYSNIQSDARLLESLAEQVEGENSGTSPGIKNKKINQSGEHVGKTKGSKESEKSSSAQGTTKKGLASIGTNTSTSSASDVSGVKKTTDNKSDYSLPNLPSPKTSFSGSSIRKQKGNLALLGLVLSLLAKANGESWKSSFKQQNEAIQNQVRMAPEIGAAIKTQAEHQSAATQAQATQSLISGITNIVSFAAAGVMGGIGAASKMGGSLKSAMFKPETTKVADTATDLASAAAKNASSAATKVSTKTSDLASDVAGSARKPSAKTTNALDDMDVPTTADAFRKNAATKASMLDEMDTPVSSASFNRSSSSKAAAKSVQEAASDAVNNPAWKDKFSRGMGVLKGKAGKGVEAMGHFLDHSMKVTQLLNMLNQGIDGITNSIYMSQAAYHQKQAGVAEAQSAELQQMASVYDKLAGQAQSLGDQAQQGFTSALDILRSASDSQAQTSASIFS